MAYVKKWSGSAWVDADVKKWTGSAWTTVPVKKWSGSAWVQIYPDTAVSTTKTISVTSGMNTYRPTYGNWSYSDARQGNGSSYGASSDCTGCLNLSSAGFTGTGSISSISSASFTGKRGGAGSYSSNQTVRFYRSNIAVNGSDPRSSLAGTFTSTTGGPGSGGTMSNRAITASQTGLKDWMNGVSSKKILYIRSNTASEYLNIQPTFSVKATYTYTAKALTFANKDDISLLNRARPLRNDEIYHTMLCYEEEAGMSLKEIIKRRTDENLPDIPEDSIVDFNEIKPYYLSYNIDKDMNFNIDIYNTKDYHKCEICWDGYNFEQLSPGDKGNHYKHIMHPDFNKYKDSIVVRVIDTRTDTLDIDLVVEPEILIV